jgi:hypothetical protein
MIRVDGHACWHALLNGNKLLYSSIVELEHNLGYTDSIAVEVSSLNLTEAIIVLDKYLPQFPNIKYALYYRTPKPYLDPNYAHQDDINKFNEWVDSHEYPVRVDLHNLSSIKHRCMPETHIDSAIHHLEGLYWIKDGMNYVENERYTGTKLPNYYYRWWRMINTNRNSYSLEQYHNMILSRLQD